MHLDVDGGQDSSPYLCLIEKTSGTVQKGLMSIVRSMVAARSQGRYLGVGKYGIRSTLRLKCRQLCVSYYNVKKRYFKTCNYIVVDFISFWLIRLWTCLNARRWTPWIFLIYIVASWFNIMFNLIGTYVRWNLRYMSYNFQLNVSFG